GTNRIRYEKLEKNAGIAENTNAGISLAKGEYIGLLDHDDLLAPHALRLIADRILKDGADMIYTDEDKVDAAGKKHFQPNFKPDFNEDLLRSNNYITHFLVVKRELAAKAGGFRSEYNGAQDYDFIFRCSETAEKIAHIPEILYHWRTHEASTADNPESKLYAYEAGKKAIEAHLERAGESGEVSLLPEYGFYRVKYPLTRKPPVSILIPNKDQVKALKACLDALRRTEYQNFEILIIENNSTEQETFDFYESLKADPKIRILTWKEGFNYAAINNFGAKEAQGEFLLFLNNDVRCVIDPGWLGEMVAVALRENVGAVGAKLYYPNNRIQHAGIVIGIGGVAGAMFVDLPRARKGYLNKASLMQDMSAVTAACMLMKKRVFDEVGGFEETLAVAFNDVDLCLKVREKGYLIVYDPFAEAYHDESRSRGAEDTEEKQRRFYTEIDYMRGRWNQILKDGDPYYNKNLSLKRWDYSLREN
ncbi:MAG: glycosyltransferase, partial [Lachnospiraceae bacterium]|nr:glycosyltransferase [Lachnospiraceae bacterium]